MRALGRLLVLLVVLLLVGGVAFYARPVAVRRQITHFGLFLSRVQSNYVMTPEGRVHYYEAEPRIPGGGTPLVLVHGLADRDESWAPMLRKLKRAGFHVYAPDLLGFGRSPHPADSDYSIATQEKFVYDFIQSLGLQKTDIAGHSMGGWITLQMALDHPDLIDRVVVFDSAGIDFPLPVQAKSVFHPDSTADVQKLLQVLEPGSKPLPEFVAKDVLREARGNQWVVDRSVSSMGNPAGMLNAKLGGITEPMLIVWGDKDGITPLAMGQEMHRLNPNSELNIVEGCGHLAPSRCAPRVAEATADFLKQEPPPKGGERTLTSMGKVKD